MNIIKGSIDSDNKPLIKISVQGAFPQLKREFDAILDTGFTGFLCMPWAAALPLGMPLMSTTSVTLADGSTSTALVTLATVSLGGQEVPGPCLLSEHSKDILVGMALLRNFKLNLLMGPLGFFLINQDELAKMWKTASEQAQRMIEQLQASKATSPTT